MVALHYIHKSFTKIKLCLDQKWRVPVDGGLYCLTPIDIMLSVADNTDSSTSDIFIKWHPLSGGDARYFTNVKTLSNILTLMPHQSSFNQPILIRFPIHFDLMQSGNILTLWYSDSETDGCYHWLKLQQNNTSSHHKDDIFWFIDTHYCYVFTQHFTHFILTEESGQPPTRSLQLRTSLHGIWLQENMGELQLVVGFYCHKCHKDVDLTKQVCLAFSKYQNTGRCFTMIFCVFNLLIQPCIRNVM